MNKSGTKIVTVKEILNGDPNSSPKVKSLRPNQKTISQNFKIYEILDDNYCCKVELIRELTQEIPDKEVKIELYNDEKFNCYSLAFSENEEMMAYFDGVKR